MELRSGTKMTSEERDRDQERGGKGGPEERSGRNFHNGGPYGEGEAEDDGGAPPRWVKWWAEEQRRMVETLAEEQRKMVRTLADRLAGVSMSREGKIPPDTHRFKMTKMTPSDDPEAYLNAFERMAVMAKWPREQWSAILAPYLTGAAQTAVDTLPLSEVQDYEKVRQSILSTLNVSEETYRQRFRDTVYQAEWGARALGNLVRSNGLRWLRPAERETEEVIELVWLEQYLSALPSAARSWVKCQDPQTLDDAIKAMEIYEAAGRTAQAGGRMTTDGRDNRRSLQTRRGDMEPARHLSPTGRGRASVYPPGLSPTGRGRAAWSVEERASTGSGERERQLGPRTGRGPRELYGAVAPPAGHPLVSPRGQGIICFRCGIRGHVRRECPQGPHPRESA